MSFGESFSQSYLGAQQQAQQAAIQEWQQKHQQAMLDLQQQLKDSALAWEQDPNNPDNIEKLARADYYKGQESTRKQGQEDAARAKAVQGYNTATSARGNGMPMRANISLLSQYPALQQEIIGSGVAQGNQENMLQALQQSPASFLAPDAGAPSMGGPMLGAPPAGSFLPPDQAGPTLPPLPAATQDVQPGMAGMRMMEPPGATAAPFSQDQFLNAPSPAFLQEQQRQQSMAANRNSMIDNRQSMMGNRDANTDLRQRQVAVSEARQKLAEHAQSLRDPLLKAQTEKLVTENDYLPDTLQAKLDNYQRIADHTDFMEGLAKSKLGLEKQAAALASKRFVASNGQKAYANLNGARKSAEDADLAVMKDSRALSMLKGQRDRIMGALDFADRPDLQAQAQDIQDQATSVQQQLAIHKQAQNVADRMRQQIEGDMVSAGVLRGPATATTEKPTAARKPQPPKMDANAIRLRYGSLYQGPPQ